MRYDQDEVLDYWDRFYSLRDTPGLPSSFARYVVREFPDLRNVIDLGCGDGRDSIFFAEMGKSVRGIDASKEAISMCNNHSRHLNLDCKFVVARNNSSSFFSVEDIVHLRSKNSAIYARFFLHAIPEEQEDKIIGEIARIDEESLRIFFEFRTPEDEFEFKQEPRHFRRFVEADDLVRKFNAKGFSLLYTTTGKGLAPYGDEDPVVARVVLERR